MEAPRTQSRFPVADVVAASMGFLFALPSLAFPYGRDQGLYHYVGREWLFHGALPYRDVLEQKTPGIFLLHGLSTLVFGEHMWSIRLIELAAVLALGVIAAYASTPIGETPARGIRGIGVLATCVVYFGFFDFWNTTQCEIWVALFVVSALASATRIRNLMVAVIACGAFCGLALAMKPPALCFDAVCAVVLLRRVLAELPDWKRRARSLAVFAACAAAPWTLLFAYFAAKGGMPALIDVLVRANGYYIKHERGVNDAGDVALATLRASHIFNPLTTVGAYALATGTFLAQRRADHATRDRYLVAIALLAATFISVLMQLKFYFYHWGVMVAATTFAMTTIAADVSAAAERRGWRPGLTSAALIANVIVPYGLSDSCEQLWCSETSHVVRYTFGHENRDEFAMSFHEDYLHYNFHDVEAVADWLSTNTSSDDRVAVRGFEPEIYAMSRRTYGGRFFWTTFLTQPARAYRREEWLAQDRSDLERIQPRYVVALREISEGPDSPSFFEPLGYVSRKDLYGFRILERR